MRIYKGGRDNSMIYLSGKGTRAFKSFKRIPQAGTLVVIQVNTLIIVHDFKTL
jgi:hypothetical protein